MNVLVTGASGFVGRSLCAHLSAQGWTVRAAVRRRERAQEVPGCEPVEVGEIGPDTDWHEALRGVDAVAHLAARAHVMQERSADPLAAFRRVNVEGTLQLARSAAAAGVQRLVFLSSVKVNGESSARPLIETDAPAPADAYGISKREAEQALSAVAGATGLPVIVLRPPLVYGPQVKANFLRLMQAVARGVPLPLASIDNRRSLVYVGNLADAIRVCLVQPGVTGGTYFVSDGEDLSTPELVRRIAAALGVRPRLWPLPPRLLEPLGAVTGRAGAVERLTRSLQVDIGALRRDAGWSPPFSVEQGLAETARWFRAIAAG